MNVAMNLVTDEKFLCVDWIIEICDASGTWIIITKIKLSKKFQWGASLVFFSRILRFKQILEKYEKKKVVYLDIRRILMVKVEMLGVDCCELEVLVLRIMISWCFGTIVFVLG